ncbi:MAG: hypothetical protein OHK93_003079 [Ramalina farinacea]|uniref:Uncharacterized protein n=1 Tax=Ramalina farinacea TaxID=258253 RepID=A0AA43TXT1_9LECA|nr:hypothetical protein [Ramalina farinacea]
MDAHKACIDDFPTDDEEYDGLLTNYQALDLAIFRASRRMYQAVFPTFWRTSRFCLETCTFVEFSDNLNKVQRDNVRILMVSYSIEHCCPFPTGDWDMLYLDTQELWTVWRGKDAMELPLCNLASFDIHLELWAGHGAANSTRSQLRTIHTVLRVLEKLGSRTLQDVSVTISYETNLGEYAFRNRLTQQQISDVSTNFQKRLKSGTERGSTLIDRLARDIRKSEALVDEFRGTMKACRKKGDVFDEKANECRKKAEEKSKKLTDRLRKQLSIEIQNELDSLYM